MNYDSATSDNELARMAAALERQNHLLERDRDLREAELEQQAALAQATLLDSQSRLREVELQEKAHRQTKEVLASCLHLQELVASLLDRLEEALAHGIVRDRIEKLSSQVQVLVALVANLSVAVTAMVSEGPSADLQAELRSIQQQIIDILRNAGQPEVVAIGSIHSGRDTDIKGR